MKNFNIYLIISLFLGTSLVAALGLSIGELPEPRFIPYSIWDMTEVGLYFIAIWWFGYMTRKKMKD